LAGARFIRNGLHALSSGGDDAGEGVSRLLPIDGSFIALWEASRIIAVGDYA
jgi:hypothetical protein